MDIDEKMVYSPSQMERNLTFLGFLFSISLLILQIWFYPISWLSYFLGLITLFAALSVFEVLSKKASILNNTFEFKVFLKTTKINRIDIKELSQAKGFPSLLILHDGQNVELPSFIHPNTIRAWMKRTGN